MRAPSAQCRRLFSSGLKGFRVHSCKQQKQQAPSPEFAGIDLGNQRVLRVSSDFWQHEGLKLLAVGSSLLVRGGAADNAWLFNCGEGTGRALLRTPWFKWSCVFVTNMSSAHINGLAAFLCQGTPKSPLSIYGPQGLRKYIRTTLRTCFTRVPSKYMVHELYTSNELRMAYQQAQGELMHEDEMYGDDLVCPKDGLLQVMKDGSHSIQAFVARASTETWGYLVKELGTSVSPAETASIGILSSGSVVDAVTSVARDVDVLVCEGVDNGGDNGGRDDFFAALAEAGVLAKAVGARSLVLTGVENRELASEAESWGLPLVAASESRCITIGERESKASASAATG